MLTLRAKTRALLLALAVLTTGFAAGEARATDWVVNVNDAAYDPIPAGGTIVYDIRVANEDLPTATAPQNTVTLTIPSGARFDGGSGTITNCLPAPATGPATVTCIVPPLQGGTAATLSARVYAAAQGNLALRVEVPVVVGNVTDREPRNNDVTERTTVTEGADIRLQVTGPASVPSGSAVTYAYTATNLGPFAASNLTLSVPVPEGLTGLQPPANCTLSGSNYACTIPGTLAVGGSATLNFGAQVSAASGSTVTVSGSVTGSIPPDPVPSNNTATFSTSVTAGSDLRIAKTRSPPGQLQLGDAVTFTLTAAYTGSDPSGLSITDVVPAIYRITSVTPSDAAWSCGVSGQQVNCTRPNGTGAGANIPLGTFTIRAEVSATGTAQNTATITAATPDPNLLNNSASDQQVTVEDAKVDLVAIKSGPASAAVGGAVSYSISTLNSGNRPFFGTVVMTDTLPAGVQVTAYTLNGWSCTPAPPVQGPGTVRCERDYTAANPLAVNAFTPAVQLTATVTAAGSLVNRMTVTTVNPNLPDPNIPNNTTSTTTEVTDPATRANLVVSKAASRTSLVAGEVQTFTIEVSNSGIAAANVVLNDTLDNLINNSTGAIGAGIVSISTAPNVATGFACTFTPIGGATGRSGLLQCRVPSLPVCTRGVNCPVVVVAVRPGGEAGPRVNLASATTSTPESSTADNSGSASYSVIAGADVFVTKNVTPERPLAGQDFTYVVTAGTVADGRSTASNVTITDTLPEGLIFVSARPSAGSCSVTPRVLEPTTATNRTVTCNLGTIGSGAQQTVEIVVRPTSATLGKTVRNLVSVRSSTAGDTNPGNDSFTLDTAIQSPVVDLQVNKTDSPDPVGIGEATVYTVTVTNNGPSAAENVTVTDTLPAAGLAFLDYSLPAGGACTTVPAPNAVGGTLRCGFPLLAARETRVILVRMEGTAKGLFPNAVEVSSDEVALGFDSNPDNNRVVEETTVTTRVDLQLEKTGPAVPVVPERPFSFTLTLLNRQEGKLTQAENTQVTDTLPAGMVLNGPPTAIAAPGAASQNSCTGTAGGTSFTCDFGTLVSGGLVTITVPVRVTATQNLPRQFTNTAVAATTSLDIDAANNRASASVTVNPPPAPALSLDKALASHQDVDGNTIISPTDTLTYTVTATNTGNVPLTNVVVTDNRITPNSGTCNTLAPGATCVLTGALTVTAQDVAAGSIVNTATADSNETPPVQDSVTVPVPRPSLAIDKVFSGSADLDGNGAISQGDRLTYTITATNTGTVALTTVLVTDTRITPSSRSCTIVVPNATCVLEGSLIVTAQDVAAGQVVNTARATSNLTPPVEDSVTVPIADPKLAIEKLLSNNEDLDGNSITTVGDRLSYTITATNTGNVPLTSVVVTDNRITPGSRTCPTVAVNGTCVLTGSLLVTAADVTAGMVVNTASAASNQTPQVDDTLTVPVFNPRLTIDKVLRGNVDADGNGFISLGDRLNYTIVAANTGNVALTNVEVTDTRITPNSIICATLAPRASCILTGTLTVAAADVSAGEIVNTATADSSETGPVQDSLSVAVFDPRLTLAKVLTGNDDADGNGLVTLGDTLTYTITATNTGNLALTNVVVTDPRLTPNSRTCATVAASATCVLTGSLTVAQQDVTDGRIVNTARAVSNETPPVEVSVTVPVAAPRLGIVKQLSGRQDADGSGNVTPGDRLTYTITATNTGDVPLTNVVVSDTRITPDSKTCATLAVNATCVLTGSLTVTAADAAKGEIVNTATADSNETGEVNTGLSVPVFKPSTKTTLSKTAGISTVKRGERVPYVIVAENVGFSPARIIDIMPPGFAYDDGSAEANGKRVTPSVDGRSLTFDKLTPDAKGAIRLELTLVATVTAAIGDNINQAQLVNPATEALVATARARVTILEEAVFDCSDIIGKVFDDRNRNGYQDEGEPGLPGVRVATVRGLLVTTDPYGRFSVGCADIPDADIGTNFIMKLDTRTLPDGYRVTTENPRKVRLTRGKVVKLNFGAAATRLVKLDINAKVFEADEDRLKAKWQLGLDRLIKALGSEPSSLRITYVGEDGTLARARLKAVAREIEQRWAVSGGAYRLRIETRILGSSTKVGP